MVRPGGVTILAVLMIVAGVAFAILGIMFVFSGSTTAVTAAKTSAGSAVMVSALGAAAGVIFLLFGGLHAVLALGILKMRNLARVLTIFLFILIGIGAVLGLGATMLHYSNAALLLNVSILVAAGLALWYLLRPHVKAAFGA
jgi:hypothetical protein